jgi:TonB family protein
LLLTGCAGAAPHDLPAQPEPLLPMDGERSPSADRRWRFAHYFNNVKSRVRERWDNGLALLADGVGDGGPTDARERYVRLRVSLTSPGALESASVDKSSGDEQLDRLAVRTFFEAQPFPKAPVELSNRKGMVEFFFAFRLDPRTRRTRFVIFRYNSADGGADSDAHQAPAPRRGGG